MPLDMEMIADQIGRAFRGESWHGPSVREVLSAVRAFPAERLSQELGSEYSVYIQFCGTPQHDLYHAGQIVLLKKAL